MAAVIGCLQAALWRPGCLLSFLRRLLVSMVTNLSVC